jgi:hypothetical protein
MVGMGRGPRLCLHAIHMTDDTGGRRARACEDLLRLADGSGASAIEVEADGMAADRRCAVARPLIRRRDPQHVEGLERRRFRAERDRPGRRPLEYGQAHFAIEKR